MFLIQSVQRNLDLFRQKGEFGRQDDDDEDVHALDAGDAWRGRGEEGGDGGVKGGGQGAGGQLSGSIQLLEYQTQLTALPVHSPHECIADVRAWFYACGHHNGRGCQLLTCILEVKLLFYRIQQL